MSRAGTRGITTQGLGQGEEVRKGRPAIPLAVGVCGEGDRAPDGAAQQYLSLSISLLWGKKMQIQQQPTLHKFISMNCQLQTSQQAGKLKENR